MTGYSAGDLLDRLATVVTHLDLGHFAVIVLPENMHPYVAAEYTTREVAHRMRTRLENRGDGMAYVARRHRAGLTIDISREVVLGTVA